MGGKGGHPFGIDGVAGVRRLRARQDGPMATRKPLMARPIQIEEGRFTEESMPPTAFSSATRRMDTAVRLPPALSRATVDSSTTPVPMAWRVSGGAKDAGMKGCANTRRNEVCVEDIPNVRRMDGELRRRLRDESDNRIEG